MSNDTLDVSHYVAAWQNSEHMTGAYSHLYVKPTILAPVNSTLILHQHSMQRPAIMCTPYRKYPCICWENVHPIKHQNNKKRNLPFCKKKKRQQAFRLRMLSLKIILKSSNFRQMLGKVCRIFEK